MTPRISGPVRYSRERLTSLEEYRAAADESDDGYNRAADEQSLFWRYVLSPGIPVNQLFSEAEYRVLQKATGPAGGFVVPTEMEPKVVSAARAASAVAQLALELQTESGDTLLLPTRTTDVAAVWTAESAGCGRRGGDQSAEGQRSRPALDPPLGSLVSRPGASVRGSGSSATRSAA
jgi:predicted phage gp36 major capsid-like protein